MLRQRSVSRFSAPSVGVTSRAAEGSSQLVFLELLIQRRNGDPQRLGGAHLVSLDLNQGLLDGHAFETIERLASKGEAIEAHLGIGARQQTQMARLHDIAL